MTQAETLLRKIWEDWEQFDREHATVWNPSIGLFREVEAWALASHAPSEAAAQPYEHLLAEQQRNYEQLGELVPENIPEIEHNDH